MKSKITIHTAPNFKPCIRVIEGDEMTEDVRDTLVSVFRELLSHKSNTAQIVFQNGNNEYLILPVEDELKYIEGIIMNKWINDSDSREKLLDLAKLITDQLNK